tara:strand:+ start:2696 stop:3277 length:582 start_codon:yes stop_codon:yes gene_type:complete
MSKLIKSNNLQEFIQEVIVESQAGLIPSCNIRAHTGGVSSVSRMASFDIRVKDCGKIFEGRGLTGMVAIVAELAADGREIRSVTPVSIYKARLEDSGYTMVMLDKPNLEEVVEEQIQGLEGSVISVDEAVEHVEVSEELTQDPDEVVDELPSDTELTAMTKVALVAFVISKGFKGNKQETKGKLIKRLRGEDV